MAAPLVFDRAFDPNHGRAVEIAPGIRRLTARNAGGYTFHGTNVYLIGTDPLVVVDPGPGDETTTAEILAAAGGARIGHVLVTHTHRDHSPGAAVIARLTGAEVVGAGPHQPARDLHLGEASTLDASADLDHRPDRLLADGDTLVAPAGRFTAIASPGHTATHLCFALDGAGEGAGLILSGDHVMAWSTSIVAPPDGAMADYMASLDRLAARPERLYLPGHGGPVRDAPAFVAGLKAHREAREAAVLSALSAGAETVAEVVERVYVDTDRRLFAAAGLSVFAQLEWLVAKGAVETEGPPRLTGRYRPVD